MPEYHPWSNRQHLFQSSDEFGRSAGGPASQPDPRPWAPFQTQADLEFADIAVQAGLNASHVNALLRLISRVAKQSASVTFKNETELRQACDRAAEELTPFVKLDVTAEYQKEPKTFEVHVRPLWDWALDLLNNPRIAPHFIWDAQRLFRHDGNEYKRFYTEPWTGDRWWDIQSRLSDIPNAVPFVFILYADKTRLSSHGTVKGYPVVARCANLPIDIRNGEHLSGGCIVGWLPIVPEPAKEEQKKGWTNFKRVIWHESFIKLLEALFQLSQTGYKHECFDEIIRWLFPLILILSADYEEQCMMALICGTKGKCSCPVCLVPLEELSDLSKTFPMRTISQAIEGYQEYLKKKSRGNAILKALGMRPVENVFWKVENSDPEKAISFDRLHTLHGGLWGKHILGDLKLILGALGWELSTKLEEHISDFPRWRDLAHFNTVIHITFADGNKLRDLAKQVFYAALDVLAQAPNSEGYWLLRMLGTYLQIDSLIGLDVHTDETLSRIESELLVFGNDLQKYIAAAKCGDIAGLKLNWDFPKAHLWKHVVQDIRTKGVARNYSTRPNEKMHGALKDAYADRSNGKDFAKQILHVDHHRLAIKLLTDRVEAESERQSAETDDEPDATIQSDTTSALGAQPMHVHMGSKLPLLTISEIEHAHHKDRAFENFRGKFTDFVNTCLPSYGIWLDRWTKKFEPTFKMREHTYLKVDYASDIDWKWATDYLRCNPMFHGHPRYDCALIQHTAEHTAFIRLIFVFKCTIMDTSFRFALVVQPYTAGIGIRRRLDRDFKLTRVKAVPRSQAIFIPVDSIIRGALLYPDPTNHGDFFVVDHIDGDMFLRTTRLCSESNS